MSADVWSPCVTPEIPSRQKQWRAQGSLLSPCFRGLFSLDICQRCAIAAFPPQGQFPCLPRSFKRFWSEKVQPLLCDHQERHVPAQPCRFCGMARASRHPAGTCTFLASQRWHNISSAAGWSGTSPPTLLILQHIPSRRGCTPALGHSLGVTLICVIAFTLQ